MKFVCTLVVLLALFGIVNAARFFMKHHPYIIVDDNENSWNKVGAQSNDDNDYFQRDNRAESDTDSQNVANVLRSLVFSPNLRRFTRNTDDLKRSEFQRTGGPILLG
ncbi:hypothetical protein M3Y94_00415500 [Aphelenchoides besseyi]|nr:hypothetical protein M3Y94_00415500 [Aphelenchoides besseyi]KAI6229615.1 hypothetical protein M3Y95_00549600 [Aphelenchoides besseyi]